MSDTSFIKGLRDRIKELEEENRKLKEEYANFKKQASEDMKEITKNQVENINLFDKLWEENKELKEKYDWLWKIYTEDVNERIEENEKLNLQIAELMWQRDWKQMVIDRLETQNKELIKRIKEHVPTQILADLHNKFKK